MVGLIEAMHALVDGKADAIVSVIGKRYTKAELEPKKLGEHAAIYNAVGMTETERKGAWQIDKDECRKQCQTMPARA